MKTIRTVYCYVVADLFHIGHLLHLKKAKKYGNFLIVGVLTDEATMERKKKPTVPYEERKQIIEALECVDTVIEQTTYSPISNILKYEPDVVVESTSHKKKEIKEVTKVVEKYGGGVVVSSYYSFQSSTQIKSKIRRNK